MLPTLAAALRSHSVGREPAPGSVKVSLSADQALGGRATLGRPHDGAAIEGASHAAEEGARRALSDVGLGGKDAVLTIHDMRSLLECIQFVRRTAVQTAVHVITTGILIALLTGIAMKLRSFGPNP